MLYIFCPQGLKGDSGPVGPVGPKGTKVSESAVHAGLENIRTIIFFVVCFSVIRESALLSWAAVSIMWLSICLKCCCELLLQTWQTKGYCYGFHNLARPYWWPYRVAFILAEGKWSTLSICGVFIYSKWYIFVLGMPNKSLYLSLSKQVFSDTEA